MPNLHTPKPDTAKVFMSGNSQAVRLPKDYRFNTDTLTIQKIGKSIILTPTTESKNCWDDFADALTEFDDNFIHFLDNREADNRQLDLAESDKNNILDSLFSG